MTAIQTSGLTKRFGEDVLAIDDLDLTVEEGEVFGFLGPNGAGKSTTINVLLDFVRPTAGSARVLGRDAQDESAAIRKRIGVLPEGAALYDRLTGREHLAWIARTKGVAGSVDVDATLERVGLTPAAGSRAVGGYSKGMAQRLAFGMAIVGDPELLILDEPSSGLDPTGMQELREIIREEADSGTTVFFSSHILGEVETVCDRLGIMNEGRLVATGTIDALREDLDLDASVTVDVDAVPDELGIESVAGVRAVDIDGTTLSISVDDPTRKIEAIRRVDERATVLDVRSTDTSLERLFNTYTGNGAAEASGATTKPVAATSEPTAGHGADGTGADGADEPTSHGAGETAADGAAEAAEVDR